VGDLVKVPFGENPSETATLLLAAAEELDLGQHVVGTTEGAFLVPAEVNETAFPPKAAKKTAAKKKG
jgi:hypothetical protein